MIDKNEIEVRIQVNYKGERLTWDVVDDDTYFDVADRVIKNVSKRLKLYPDETWVKSKIEAQEDIELTYNQDHKEEHKESEEE